MGWHTRDRLIVFGEEAVRMHQGTGLQRLSRALDQLRDGLEAQVSLHLGAICVSLSVDDCSI